MDSNMKQKKVITINLTRIDLENIKSGESITSKVKTNFETEVPYEVVVNSENQKESNKAL